MAVVKKTTPTPVPTPTIPKGKAVSSTSTFNSSVAGPGFGRFGTSDIFNIPQAPKQTGQITPMAASTSRDPHINPGTGVWDDNYFAANQGFQMPDFEYSEPDWDAMYRGANAQLDASQQELTGQQPITEAGIRTQGDQQKSEYDTLQSKGLAQYATNKGETNTQLADAMKMARQYFNEFSQNYLSQFGSGTSAGGAALELLGRGTQQVMGQAQNAATENIRKIDTAVAQLGEFVNTKKAEIETNVQNKLAEAQQWFKNQLAQINASRAGLESDKVAKRYEALRAREDFTNNIKYQAAMQQAEWDNYAKQQLANVKSSAGGYQYGNYTPDMLMGTQQSMANIPVLNGKPVQGPGLGWNGDYARFNQQGQFAGIQQGSPLSMLNRGGKNLVQLPNGLFYDPETGQIAS